MTKSNFKYNQIFKVNICPVGDPGLRCEIPSEPCRKVPVGINRRDTSISSRTKRKTLEKSEETREVEAVIAIDESACIETVIVESLKICTKTDATRNSANIICISLALKYFIFFNLQ